MASDVLSGEEVAVPPAVRPDASGTSRGTLPPSFYRQQFDRVNWPGEVSIMSVSTALVRPHSRALERSERERRRVIVARLRWIESSLTAEEIACALRRENPPIIVSSRTVERDFIAIRDDARRYLTATNFDARFEVGAALARCELLARKATQRALANDGPTAARWARVAVAATQARMQLLQDVNLIDRTLGRLIVDDGQRADRVPSGLELQKLFDAIRVTDAEITSEAEIAYSYGDAAAAEAAARGAKG